MTTTPCPDELARPTWRYFALRVVLCVSLYANLMTVYGCWGWRKEAAYQESQRVKP